MNKSSFYPIYLLLQFSIALFLCGCNSVTDSGSKGEFSEPCSGNQVSDGRFTLHCLEGKNILKLKTFESSIFAGTDNDFYRKQINADEWMSLGLKDVKVRTFLVLSDDHYLATYNYNDRDSLTIAQTTSGGQRWRPFRNGYAGGKTRWIPSAMRRVPAEPGVIYAGGPGDSIVAKSEDAGRSWELLFRPWDSFGFLWFLNIDDSDPANIWAGGSTAVSTGRLVKSTDGGETWYLMDTYLTGGDAIWDLVISSDNSNHILTAQNSGIVKSTDGGGNARYVLQEGRMYAFARSAGDPGTIYAAGEISEGRQAFFTSRDFGETWDKTAMDDSPTGLYVNDMVSVMEDGREVLYLGTSKGMYTYGFGE